MGVFQSPVSMSHVLQKVVWDEWWWMSSIPSMGEEQKYTQKDPEAQQNGRL